MEEIRVMLNAPDITTRSGIRDRAMLHLCFDANLQVSVLVSASLENLSQRQPASILVRGRGRRERSIPLWKETTETINASHYWMSEDIMPGKSLRSSTRLREA
jgi:integrase/recombinase XerD